MSHRDAHSACQIPTHTAGRMSRGRNLQKRFDESGVILEKCVSRQRLHYDPRHSTGLVPPEVFPESGWGENPR